MIHSVNPDILLLCETKLQGNDKIDLQGYICYPITKVTQNNTDNNDRKVLKKTAETGSGRVAILLKVFFEKEKYYTCIYM